MAIRLFTQDPAVAAVLPGPRRLLDVQDPAVFRVGGVPLVVSIFANLNAVAGAAVVVLADAILASLTAVSRPVNVYMFDEVGLSNFGQVPIIAIESIGNGITEQVAQLGVGAAFDPIGTGVTVQVAQLDLQTIESIGAGLREQIAELTAQGIDPVGAGLIEQVPQAERNVIESVAQGIVVQTKSFLPVIVVVPENAP